jgi:ribosomal protein S18 acetylase RimI-like enzyme
MAHSMHRAHSIKRLVLVVVSLITLGVGAWFYQTHYGQGIYAYDPGKDREFILQLFKDNYYWLVAENCYDFSAPYILDNRASSKKPQDKGNLIIRTYRKYNKPIGFIAYYLKDAFAGHILFLAIEEKERSHGYGRKLLDYAIKDLAHRGCIVINMDTRANNKPGIKLYESMGFKQVRNDGSFILFVKKID